MSAINNVILTHCGISPDTSLPLVRATPADAHICLNAGVEVIVLHATIKKRKEHMRADDIPFRKSSPRVT